MAYWRHGLGVGVAVMMAAGCSASPTAQAADAPPPAPLCMVEGAAKLDPPMADAAICARFLAALDATLALPDSPAAASRDGWQFRLRFAAPGVATAFMSQSDAAHAIDVNIAVSDRPLDGYAVESLGQAVAQRLIAGM